jgi:hypothetical protein
MKKKYWEKLILSLTISLIIVTIPIFSANRVVVGNNTGKEPSRVPKTTKKAKIDGVLEDPIWQDALMLSLDYEGSPGYNIKPPVRTEVLLIYSDSHLYVAFRAFDPNPATIRARYTDRDGFGGDDWVAVLFDTFNDSRRTFNFCCNPLGVQADMIESTVGGGHKWDAIWDSSGKITDWGYVIEMAIPFSSMRFQKSEGDQVWGIDAMRGYPRSSYHSMYLFPMDRSNNCRMCKAEKIIGFQGASQGKDLEFDPTLSAIYSQDRAPYTKDEFETKEKKVAPGITARWSIGPGVTLNAAVNPDFSNVEADSAQLDVNKQFALFYPEKRPFFIEGFSIFNTRLLAVNTRAFADPDWGIKLSGKSGKNAFGFFTAQDSITNFIFPGSQGSRSTSLAVNTYGTVARYRRDMGKSSTLGLLVTDREGDDYYNRMAGFDVDWRFTKKDRLRMQFLGSQTHYPGRVAADFGQPDGDFKGKGLDLFYFHHTKKINWYLTYKDIDDKFRADLGYMPQGGYRFYDGGWEYLSRRRAGSWYTYLGLGGGYTYTGDRENNMLNTTISLWLNYRGPQQSFIDLAALLGKRSYAGLEFDNNKFTFSGGMQPGLFVLELTAVAGDQVDFVNIRQGKIFRLNPIIEYKAAPHLVTRVDHIYERLQVQGACLYTANITNFHAIYHFNRRTFFRGVLQYVNYNFNMELYSIVFEDLQKQFFTQFLFSYKINPQTVLYLGYSDNYDGNREFNLIRNNRALFFKIGYALRL